MVEQQRRDIEQLRRENGELRERISKQAASPDMRELLVEYMQLKKALEGGQ